MAKIPNLNDLKNMADSSGLLNKAKAMFDSLTSSIGGVPTPLTEEELANPVRARLYECELLLQQIKTGQIANMKLINNLDTALGQLNKLITEPVPADAENKIPTEEAEPIVPTASAADIIEEKEIEETEVQVKDKSEK